MPREQALFRVLQDESQAGRGKGRCPFRSETSTFTHHAYYSCRFISIKLQAENLLEFSSKKTMHLFFISCSLELAGHQSAIYPVSVLWSCQKNMAWEAAGANRDGEKEREQRKTAGESVAMCRGTWEALGRNLNRRRLLRRQEMRGRLVPGMGLNWMFQTQTGIRKRRLMRRC